MNTFIRQALGIWAALLVALVSAPATSQTFTDTQYQYMSDIDIYGQSSSGTAPNVLVILDNSGNWSSPFNNEIRALTDLMATLDTGAFRLGLMMFTESGGSNSGNDGGYVRAAIRSLNATKGGVTYRDAFTDLLNDLNKNNDKSNAGKMAVTMAEAYSYFSARTPYSGNNKDKADFPVFTGDSLRSTATKVVDGFPGNALASKAATTYQSPIASGCAANYIIIISNGPTQDPSSDNAKSSELLSAAYSRLGVTRPADITGLSPNSSQDNYADEWAYFMKNVAAERITTFAIEVDPGTTQQAQGWSALLQSMADNSGGKRYSASSADANDLRSKLVNTFNEIQGVNSVFASASLPVALNSTGSYLNQVFMGLFRPDTNGLPRWRGNLKQYRFGYDRLTDSISLVDSLGQPAVSSGTDGFLSPTAVSYWTGASTFWSKQPLGTNNPTSDSPDGPWVEKGGIAQGLRTTYATSQDARKVYTCIDCTTTTTLGTSATLFTNANSSITAAMLGITTASPGSTIAADRTALINWVRGADNAGDEKGPGGSVTVRPGIHGDVLHSRPTVLNYGGSTGTVVFYGGNDGMVHAVDGNQSTATSSTAGQELWSFVPQEHMARLRRLRDNTPEVRLSTSLTVSGVTTSTPRDYFVDGPIGFYQKVDSSGVTQKAIIFVAMRRGGDQVYALDVTTPTSPKFLWKLVSSATLPLGQTWSEPKVVKLKGYADPVVIMGGGYDNAAEDQKVPGTTTKGNFVLLVNALNGTVLNNGSAPMARSNFTTDRSVAADVTVLDTDQDGYIDRAYAVDVGGNVYRLDFGDSGTSDWGMYKLASLGGSTPPRKFFYAPDVVLTRGFAAVLAATGDREKPLVATSADSFYTVYDTRLAKGKAATAPTAITRSDLYAIGATTTKPAGCYLDLGTAGEKAINAPKTVAGITYFGTNTPNYTTSTSASSCKNNLGDAKLYQVPLFCGTPVTSAIGQGFPPSVVSGVVTVRYDTGATDSSGNAVFADKQVPFLIGGPNSKASGLEATRIKPLVVPVRQRRYWYMENAR